MHATNVAWLQETLRILISTLQKRRGKGSQHRYFHSSQRPRHKLTVALAILCVITQKELRKAGSKHTYAQLMTDVQNLAGGFGK